MQRQKTVTLLASGALLAIALGDVLLRSPTTVPAGLLLLGVSSGIVLHTWLRSRRS